MKKFSMFFTACALCVSAGFFAACSGSSDENEPTIDGEVVGPITLTVDKSTIEASGEDFATLIVKDANGQILTNSKEHLKHLYFENVTTGEYLESQTNVFFSIEDGNYEIKAYYNDMETEKTVTVKVQNRKKYETFYRKIAVFKMTGSWCVNCPSMTEALRKVNQKVPNRMVELAFHASSSEVTDPFHLNETNLLAQQFGAQGFPTCIYNLNLLSIQRSTAQIESILMEQRIKYPATCGIKINSVYDANAGAITVNAGLISSKGDKYELVYALVRDGLTAGSNAYESVYDYTLMAITPNFLKPAAPFTVAKDEEHVAPAFTISNVFGLDPDKSRVVVYSLRQAGDAYIVDNITECAINGEIDYKYNK